MIWGKTVGQKDAVWTQPQTNWVKMIRNTDVTFVSMPASLNSTEDAEVCIIQKCECWTWFYFLFVVVFRVAPCFLGGGGVYSLITWGKSLCTFIINRLNSHRRNREGDDTANMTRTLVWEQRAKEWTLITTSTTSDVKQQLFPTWNRRPDERDVDLRERFASVFFEINPDWKVKMLCKT